jgi:serine/threonine protein kinase
MLAPLPLGTTIGGYRIERVLGRGGFGITYLATDPVLAKSFALKEYAPEELLVRTAKHELEPRDQKCRGRFSAGLHSFREEGRRLARFSHKNIVRVSRFFEANGSAYLVMDFEAGGSLRSLLETRVPPWPEADIRALLLPICAGVAALHEVGVVHGDLKPENIVLRSDGEPVVIDFGACLELATPMDEQHVFATPGYAPPEQAAGVGPYGPWIDVFALAATVYELMVGERPRWVRRGFGFDPAIPAGASAHAALEWRIPAAADMVREPYSTQLMLVLDRCLELDYRARPASASALSQALSYAGGIDTANSIEDIARKMVVHFANWAKPNDGLYTDEFAMFCAAFPIMDFAWRLSTDVVTKQVMGVLIDERRALTFAQELEKNLQERGFPSRRSCVDFLTLCERSDAYAAAYRADRRQQTWTYGLLRQEAAKHCLAAHAMTDAASFGELMENVIDRARGRVKKVVQKALTPYYWIHTDAGWEKRLKDDLH